MAMSMLERINYILTHQAYGDALCKFTEFQSREDILRTYPRGISFDTAIFNEHSSAWGRYDWTDDTDMAVLVVRATLRAKETGDYTGEFARSLAAWYKHGFPEIGKPSAGIGNYVRWVINNVDYAERPVEYAREIWELSECDNLENGALMRCGIIGAMFDNLPDAMHAAVMITVATHMDPRCQVASAFLVAMVWTLCNTRLGYVRSVQQSLDACSSMDGTSWLRTILAPLLDFTYQPEKVDYNIPSERGDITYTLPLALWCLHEVMVYGFSFHRVIENVAYCGGDTDTNAAVAGVMLGAYLSRKRIALAPSVPEKFIMHTSICLPKLLVS
jgi:ADP-ribosylglycohydrolase